MKVLHVIDHMGLGGAQRLVHDLVETRAPDIEASVCALRRRDLPGVGERFATAGVGYRALGFTRDNPFGPFGVRALIRETRPDVLQLNLEYSALLGTLAALSLTGPRPVVAVLVANDPHRHALLPRWSAPLLASRVDVHLVLSASNRDAFLRAYSGRHRRVELVPPGVDLARFDRARADAGRVAAYRGGARRVIGAMARLAPQKAIHVLLDATPLLLRDDRETRVLIVGSGPLRGALERRAHRLGIAHAVTFAGYQEDVVSAYAAMDVFVLPSRDEGFAVVFMEAMAMGVPVVGTRVIGNIDAVEDGVTGLLVPYEDAPALARAVLSILADDGLRQRLCMAAAERARQSYSRQRFTARVEALYREVAGEHQTAKP